MKKKYIVSFLLSLIFAFSIPVTVYAAEYGSEYPDYVKFSGGAYIEVQSAIGRGTIVLQDTYKTGYIGFTGDSYYLCNLSNSTITGRFVTTNGTVYNCRFSSFEAPQYYQDSGMSGQWRYLNTSDVLNTNVELIDLTDKDRGNLIDIFDHNVFYYTILALVSIMLGVAISISMRVSRL